MADEKYIEVANFRLKKAIKYIRMIARMTGSKTYAVEEEDIIKITERLTQETDRITSAFNGRTKKAKEEIEDIL